MADNRNDPRLESLDAFLSGPVRRPAQPTVTPVMDVSVPVDHRTEAQKLAADLAQIRAANSDPTSLALLTLSRDRGNSLTAGNQIIQDYERLSPTEFQRQYGIDVYDQMVAAGIGGHHIRDLAATDRTVEQATADSIMDVGSGLAQGVLGLTSFANQLAPNGPVGDYLQGGIAKASEAVREFTDEHLTKERQRLNFVNSLRGELDRQDNEAIREREAEQYGDFVAGLRAEGRSILNWAGRMMEDPSMLGASIAEGAGSLVLGGPAGRAASRATQAANRLVPRRLNGAAQQLFEEAVDRAADRLGFPTAIVAMESGGAANQAAQEVLNMSQEELAQQEAYQELVASGMSEEAARLRIAARAADVAAVITAPAAAVTSRLVSRFEQAPLVRNTAGGVAGNSAREFVEEGVQSGVGQLASNVGQVVSGADEDQSLIEGVGEATIEGAVAGAGTAGVFQGPGVVLRETARAAGAPFKYAGRNIRERHERILAEAERESSVSTENMAEDVAAVTANAPAVAEGLRALADSESPEVQTYIDRIQTVAEIQEDDLDVLTAPMVQELRTMSDQIGRAPNRFDAAIKMADAILDEDVAGADKRSAAIFLLKQTENLGKTLQDDFPAFLENASHDRPEFQQFQNYAATLTAIQDTPRIKEALKWARHQMQQEERDLSTVDLRAPEGQQIVRETVDLATYAPQAIDPRTAEHVLLQADQGVVELTPAQRRIIRSATALQNSARLHAALNRVPEPGMVEDDAAELQAELRTTQDRDGMMEFITRQIETEGGNARHQLSLKDHAAGINLAVSQGNLKEAKLRARRLGAFARSHANKVMAANQSIRNGDGKNVPYEAFDGKEMYTAKKGWGVVLGNEGSEKAARQIHAEAVAIAELSNQFRQIYPAFNMREVVVPDLALPSEAERISVDNQQDIEGNEGSSTTPLPEPSQATTSRTDPITVESELPSPPSQQTRAPEVKTPPVEVEAVDEAATDQAGNADDAVVETVNEGSTPEAEGRLTSEVQTSSDQDPVAAAVPDQTEAEESDGSSEVIELIEAVDETAPDTLTVAEAFPSLVQPNGRNWFHESFRLTQEPSSRLSGMDHPMRTVFQALSNSDALERLFSGYDITGGDALNYQTLLREYGLVVLDQMVKSRKAKMAKPIKGHASISAALDAGDQSVLRPSNLRALNIIEKIGDEYRYNPQLVQSAVLAGLDWAINAQDRQAKLDAEDVAKIMGVSEVDAASYVDEFNRGLSLDMAVRNLAQQIRRFWGLNINPEAPDAYAKGIPEAVAKEVMRGLETAGLIKLGQINAESLNGKTYNRVWLDERTDETKALIDNLNGVHELLGDIALIDRESEGYQIGGPVTRIDRTQLHNPMVETTEQQKQALRNVQNTRYLPNMMVFDFIQSMGLESFVTLFSGYPYKRGDLNKTHKDMKLNKVHWKSIQGKQRSLVASFEHVTRQMAAVRRHAEQNNIPIEQVASHYKFGINKLGRLQMAGLANPQADKLAREIFMSTGSVLDLSNRDSDDFTFFLATVGQGIGEKTENLSFDRIRENVEARVFAPDGDLRPLVDAFSTWLEDRDSGQDAPLYTGVTELLTNAGLSMHGLHSLLAVAKYERTRDSGGDLTRFETSNYLEADGKTNGPINALMLMTGHGFTENHTRLVAKGGVFFGNHGPEGRTLDQQYAVDSQDLYGANAQLTQEKIVKLGHDLSIEHPMVHEQFEAFRRVMGSIGIKDLSVDEDGNLTIGRGVLKNPLTITIYGSGADGIAGKITREVTDLIYSKLSEGASLPEDLVRLVTHIPINSRKDGLLLIPSKAGEPSGNALDFEFSRAQFDALKANIRMFLVDPLREAIDETVGTHVNSTTTAIQEATQIQSIVLKHLFIREITAAIAAKNLNPGEGDYRPGDFLSQKEQDDIRNNLRAFSPIIETGTQSYMLSGGETSDLFEGTTISVQGKEIKVSMPKNFSEALAGDLSTPAFVQGYTLSGVRATPTLVVGSGDGQMMLNALSSNPGLAAKTLPTFDGLQMSAQSMKEFSREINKAVFDTWTSNANPVRAVQESFASFQSANPFDELFPQSETFNSQQMEALRELTKVIKGKGKIEDKEIITDISEVKQFAQDRAQALESAALSTDIRRQVIAETPMSVDHMASAKAAYVNEGSLPLAPGASPKEVAQAMSYRYDELLKESIEARADARVVEPENPKIVEIVQRLGQEDDTGARVFQGRALTSFLRSLNDVLTPTQKEIARHALKSLEGSDYRVVFGNGDQLDAWERVYNADDFIPNTTDIYGKIDTKNKIILIRNPSGETIVHELVHAATFGKVQLYYSDPSMLSKEDRDAVARIEGLMGEWISETYNPNGPFASTYRVARSQVQKYLRNDQKAGAVNEFMAWVLGNQDLAKRASYTKVVNPLFRIVGDALKALKNLIWGGPNKGARVGDSLLSNLRFNTRVLMATPTPVQKLRKDFAETVLFQSASFGSNDRLTELRRGFNNRIVSWLRDAGQPLGNDAVSRARTLNRRHKLAAEVREARQAADDIGNSFAAFFPSLGTMQGWSTFKAIQVALMTETELNTSSLSRLEDLYSHVIRNLTREALQDDPDGNDPNDVLWAQQKLDALHGLYAVKSDKHGRSSLMSSFLALAMVDDGFRKVLSRMDKPKSDGTSDYEAGNLDAILEQVGNSTFDRLSTWLSGEKRKDGNVQEAIDHLVSSMITNVGDQRSFIAQRAENGFDRIENYVADNIQNLSDKAAEKARDVVATSNSRVARAGARLTTLVTTAINEKSAQEAALGITSWLNRRDGVESIRALLNDVVGRTRENASVFNMISRVRAVIQQTRQQFRDELPKKLSRSFKKHVSKDQWTAMYKALGKTDLAALAHQFGVPGALELVSTPQRLGFEIRQLENSIRGLDPRRFNLIQAKSQQLAHYMNTGEQGAKLLRNAEAVARLLGETGSVNLNPDPQLVEQIDRLVTLYAIQGLDQSVLDTMTDLISTEREGVEFVTNYLVGQRVDELNKLQGNMTALLNHYKGHIPSETQNGGSLIIASDSEHAHLVTRGYTRLSAYTGSSADRWVGRRSYYFSPVSGQVPFSQGVLQTVHQTASGIDPETGYTVDEVMAGRIEDPRMVSLIERQLANQTQTRENLLPVYNDQGKVVAFERAADTAKLVGLNRSTDLAKMIGAWRGRQVEELFAQEVNRQLVDNLKAIWDEGRKEGRQNEFVNIARLNPANDPVLAEAARLIPKQARDHIREVFGPNEFWVRRDMLLDTLGSRQASVGDLFTGKTRWDPKVASKFEKLAVGMFDIVGQGRNAYKYLVSTEKNVQELVSNIRTLIVVRSVVVPVSNMVSNFFQLLNRGVPLRDIIRGAGAKTTEINAYIKRRKREIDLEADLRAALGARNIIEERKIRNEIQSLQDSYRRMSIWPLIEAGEFSAISNGEVLAEDLALADGKWTDWVERKVNELPKGLRTPVRYAMITRDTALFQGLARSVQYGDFVAKAILYDDLTKRKKVVKPEAVATVNEAFVNYNRLAGRSRQYLESVGLLWFYNYKLRIMKEAAWTLRHNPLRSLLAIAMPALPFIGNIGLPITDNFVSVTLDGRLEYSIGPGMGLNSWSLNPWINMVR